jgi:Nucleotidyl transferase AbiEii toxin, Type IV TA system
MQLFSPKVESLAEPQQRLWRELGSTPSEFVLYGGTALALQLEDFDFFSNIPFSGNELLNTVPYLREAVVLQQEPNTLTCAVNRSGEIKVSFLGDLKLKKVREPLCAEGIQLKVASTLDIAATKLGLIQQRPYYRDYFDLYTLINAGVSLAEGLSAAQTVYGESFDPRVSLKALAFFQDGDLHRLSAEIQNRLRAEAAKIDLNKLPQVKSWAGKITP